MWQHKFYGKNPPMHTQKIPLFMEFTTLNTSNFLGNMYNWSDYLLVASIQRLLSSEAYIMLILISKVSA